MSDHGEVVRDLASASPTVRRRALANALKRLRVASELLLEDAAGALEVSVPTISRYEKGVRIPRARDVRELCRLYGASDATITELVDLVSGAKESGWWESYSEADEFGISTFIGFEASATHMLEYSQSVVPGLLQTAEYTRQVYLGAVSRGRDKRMSDHDIDKMVEIRMKRQERLGKGLTLAVVVDESVLQRVIGGQDVQRRQLESLARSSRSPAVSLRILPFSTGAHPGHTGEFQVLSIPHEEVSDIVHLESLTGYTMLDRKDIVRQYRHAFSVMYDVAASEQQSTAWLERIVMGS